MLYHLLHDTEHTHLPSRSLSSPRLMGPFRVLARTAPNTYRLDRPAMRRVFPEFNVERLHPTSDDPPASVATRMRPVTADGLVTPV